MNWGDALIILGIDPGLATMGWGVIESDGSRHRLIQYGTLGTPAGQPVPVRLRAIYSGVQQLISTYRPDDIVFEELFFARNVTTALNVGAARGVALLAAAQYTENLYEYTPMQIKQAVVGFGKAEKRQVQMMVKMLLGLSEVPRPETRRTGWPQRLRTRTRRVSGSCLRYNKGERRKAHVCTYRGARGGKARGRTGH